ncbi:hypothetical protein MS6204_04581 [Escherichia coli]|nr:hypothetical protein [Escherichia coli]
MFANSMPIQQDSPTICSEPVACSATISFCESGICHRSGCTYLIPIRPQGVTQVGSGKAREDLIVANWPDIFRCAATMTAGKSGPANSCASSLLTHDKTTLQLRFVKLVVLNGPFSLLSGSWIRTCSGVLRSVLTRERPTMRSKMRSVSGGRGKFAIARQRGSTTESLGSIY